MVKFYVQIIRKIRKTLFEQEGHNYSMIFRSYFGAMCMGIFIPPPYDSLQKKGLRILISLLIYAKTTPEMSAFLYLNDNNKLG